MIRIVKPLVWRDRTLARVLFPLIACALMASPVDAGEATITTGNALHMLPAELPTAPPGFESSTQLILAIQTKQVPLIDLVPADRVDVTVTPDVVYGDAGDRPLKLDLYRPSDNQNRAGLVFIHGGGWGVGRKEDYRFYGMMFAERRYVVASAQYRLSGEATFPAALYDVKAAVRWMRANAESLGIDPNRIGLVGGSAGGHLALLAAYTADIDELEGHCGSPGVSSRVQSVVDIYGPADLTTAWVRESSLTITMLERFMGGSIGDHQQLYEAASPIRYVTPNDPPTLILHGTIDQLVPVDQSDRLAATLKDIGVPYLYDRLPGWGHAMDLTVPVNERCVRLMEQFLASTLK